MYTVRCSLFDVHCSMYTVRCSLFDVHCSVYTVRCSPSVSARRMAMWVPERVWGWVPGRVAGWAAGVLQWDRHTFPWMETHVSSLQVKSHHCSSCHLPLHVLCYSLSHARGTVAGRHQSGIIMVYQISTNYIINVYIRKSLSKDRIHYTYNIGIWLQNKNIFFSKVFMK